MGNNEVKRRRALVVYQHSLRKKLNDFRSFGRLVEKIDFADTFLAAPDSEITLLDEITERQSLIELTAWLTRNLVIHDDDLSYRQLREWCRQNHIPRWSRLTREEMLEIRRKHESKSLASSESSERSATAVC